MSRLQAIITRTQQYEYLNMDITKLPGMFLTIILSDILAK